MKKPIKIGLGILGVILLLVVGLFTLEFVVPMFRLFHYFDKQMAAGRKYMDSLTEKDFQIWTERTQRYLSEFDPKAYVIGAKPVPPELKQLKIVRIDEDSNWVSYVWMGGMDHTELLVEKLANGSFQFTARYDDESNRVIWPKTPNTNQLQTNSPFQLIEQFPNVHGFHARRTDGR